MAYLERVEFDILCVEPEGTWIYETLPALISADKPVITADSVDTAVVTATVPEGVAEVQFYDNDTGDLISLKPASENKATLEVIAATPGVIRIRAGEKTRTQYNTVEVVAIAQA